MNVLNRTKQNHFTMLHQMNKRKPMSCLSNSPVKMHKELLKLSHVDATQLMPISINTEEDLMSNKENNIYLQNKHPLLAMYKHDVPSDDMSFSDLTNMLSLDDETQMLEFITDMGLIATFHQCEFCGGQMRKVKQGNIWYWLCTKRVDGVKCNKGKFGIRKGTFFDHSKFSIQTILRICWNFVYKLSVSQCKQYAAISTATNHTVVEFYADCRQVCTSWIWDEKHVPKLGGFGKVVEMDESYFAGAPKFNRGRRLGTTWDDEEKWVFGLVQRDSLNCILKQVPSNRSRKTLMPIISQHCAEGTIFHSDGWKAYHKLADQLDLEDCLHYSVNHSSNYVDPDTGSHTQTIEGLWSHVKDFLPVRGMKPHDLYSYLGWFMWDRNCREMKKDLFIHFMKCAAEQRPHTFKINWQLPPATVTRIVRQPDEEDNDFIV